MAVATIDFFSQSLQKATAFTAVFPHDPAIPRPWGVLYLLHGLSDDHTNWLRRSNIDRYVEESRLPLIVVMPDGYRGWYTNAKEGARHEDDLIVDVLGFAERTFPIRAERAGRSIGGLSMGGYGAVKNGLKHHDLFASVHSHSGALDMFRDTERVKSLGPEFLRIFGPDAAGGPDDPHAIVERVDHGRLPKLRIDCGVDDFLIEQNRSFHKHLESLHIAHEYQEFPGAHNWAYWDEHVREAIAFHARNLGLKPPGE